MSGGWEGGGASSNLSPRAPARITFKVPSAGYRSQLGVDLRWCEACRVVGRWQEGKGLSRCLICPSLPSPASSGVLSL